MTRGRRIALVAGSLSIAALTAGIVLLTVLPEPEEAEPSPSPSTANTGALIQETLDNVREVEFFPREGASFGVRREDGAYLLDMPGALFPGASSVMSLSFNSAINIPSAKIIAENASGEQMTAFGLAAPEVRWVVNRIDGTSAELFLGAEAATGSGRYACAKNGDTVFLLNATQSGNLIKTAEEYFDLSFLKGVTPTEESPAWTQIVNAVLEKDGEVIEVKRRTDEELAELDLGSSRYCLVQPAGGEGNDYIIQTALLEPAAAILPSEIAEAAPQDLSVYGLDEPARLTLTGAEGWSGTLLIGNFDSERGGRYVMIEGVDCVLLEAAGSYAFLDASYAYLRSSLIWLHNITDVAAVTFELEGETRRLTFEHLDEQSLRGFLDGEEITGADETGETNARRLYEAALNVTHDGGSDAEIPAGKAAYRLTMEFADGRQNETIELYSLNERQYLIAHNGENLHLLINRTSLREKLLEKFELLDAGLDIPRF